MNRGWDPIFPVCDGNAPPLMGLYSPRTALWSSNQSAINQLDCGFLTVQSGVDPRKLGLLPRLMKVLEMWNDLWTGDGPVYPEVELAQHKNHDQIIGWWGWDFHTVRRGINLDDIRVRPRVVGVVVDVWMNSDPGM